uniref:E3 ubiquitin-protein ligase RNF103-like isoform X4 n=1 Tax=Doryrhamphus excisus TaxID=161450 RepID=UPI0025ADDB8D|nr:E3 ubiquitin-protein ligase RNF103-like isoform X4 [Doryrhamphus excisus]
MWLKLFFLLLYFVVLFMLARIFEAVVWYETGVFATQLVDPVSLSYKKLKTILECRGLAYTGLAEKKDVSQLVEKSGELTHGELYSAVKKEKEQKEAGEVSSTHFSGEMHFYELVEDTKDGIWLIQVIAQDREALLGKSNWVKMVQKVSQFGIRTGTFNCSHDQRSCIRRGWEHSTLIMSVPQTSASKGKVMLKEYNGRRIETEYIFRWMTSHMSHRIKTLCDTEKLLEEWNPDPLHPLKMFLFAPLPQPPVFFSSLSVKFTGRIEFIFVDVRHWDNQNSLLELGVTQSAAYILKMPEGLYHYGNSTGEFLSVAAMDTFLRSVQPEVNDLFVLSLVLINLLAWMDLFITQGATVKRFVVLIRTLGTYNSMLLLSWLPILALLQLSYLESLYGYSLKLLRYTDTTTLASLDTSTKQVGISMDGASRLPEVKAIQQTRRLLANARERTRVHTISAAFEALRKQVPCYSYGQKLSKLAILRIACNYILSLAQLAELDYSSDHSNQSFSQCVEQCTRTLQAEGRSKKRKDPAPPRCGLAQLSSGERQGHPGLVTSQSQSTYRQPFPPTLSYGQFGVAN